MGGLLSKSIPFEGLSENDTVIVVIGPSGSGKSTFINTAAGGPGSGGELLNVGKGLEPCTKEVAHILCIPENGQNRIVFVDTPPFPNPDERMKNQEKATEKKIADWLKRAFGKQIRVSGILYLYNSTDNRMTQPPAVHFRMFQNLCGDDFQGRVLLVMTMWERVRPEHRETRQRALTKNWGYRSSVVQHLGTKESAWDIVRNLLDGQNTRRNTV